MAREPFGEDRRHQTTNRVLVVSDATRLAMADDEVDPP